MKDCSRELLRAYVDDALSDVESSKLEHALRADEALRSKLREVINERDRGDHSLGAIWRRDRLTCPTREQLGSYVLEVLDDNLQTYIDFHLKTVACPGCLANLADIQEHEQEEPPKKSTRRQRYYQSSAGLLRKK